MIEGPTTSPIDTLDHLLDNYMNFRSVASEVSEQNDDVGKFTTYLYDPKWIGQVKAAVQIYRPLWNLIDGSKTQKMVWSVNAILRLKSPSPSLNDNYQNFKNQTLTLLTLMSFIFDPHSDQGLMNDSHHDLILTTCFRVIPKNETSHFLKYKRMDKVFQIDGDMVTAEEYWEKYEHGEFKDLAKIAQNFVKMPSSSYTKSFAIPQHYQKNYDFEFSEKIIAIKLDVD